jgi:tetratricopeptide (TPR) repeat protein
MAKHPSQEALEDFLLARLEGSDRRDVAVHLLRGCRRCRRRLAPLAAALLGPSLAEPPDGGDRYDLAIRRAERRAIARLEREGNGRQSARPGTVLKLETREGNDRYRSQAQFQRCQNALAETRALRHSDPEEMLMLARINASISDLLDPSAFPEGAVHDLQARAYMELGNALRVTNDLVAAKGAFTAAAERVNLGTGDPFLSAELLSLASSLFRATREFKMAYSLLDRTLEIYRELGEKQLVGRTMMKQGIAKGYDGEVSQAIALLGQAIMILDRDRDPELYLSGVHSLIWFQVENGGFAEGRELVRRHRHLYREASRDLTSLRLRWVEARIAAGLGEWIEAEKGYREARAGFAQHNNAYLVALISLDLAALWLKEGRTAEIAAMLAETLATFRALCIHREAIATLLMLGEAAEAERLNLTLLRAAAAKLRQFESDPGGTAGGRQ